MRLDRFIARQTGRTRKEARQLIAQGRVCIDGAPERRANAPLDPAAQAVTLDGAPLDAAEHLHLMLHKPQGVVSARSDDLHRTVIDLVPQRWRRSGLTHVGRLDLDTTGLLILTTDGTLNHRLTHPRRKLDKVYELRFTGELAPDAVERVAVGIALRDGTLCKPAQLELLGPDAARLTLREGRYHQVKRMIAACGGRVLALHRSRVGGLSLDPDLAPGACRPLDDVEINAIFEGPGVVSDPAL